MRLVLRDQVLTFYHHGKSISVTVFLVLQAEHVHVDSQPPILAIIFWTHFKTQEYQIIDQEALDNLHHHHASGPLPGKWTPGPPSSPNHLLYASVSLEKKNKALHTYKVHWKNYTSFHKQKEMKAGNKGKRRPYGRKNIQKK